MAGHSKWAQIKRDKGANDVKRGVAFTKLGKAISIAAREGGGDPAANFKLRLAIEQAKGANMPKDTIDRAVKRGTGELGGAAIEQMMYEGFGPGGCAILVETVTDNKNRTLGEVRQLFERNGGKLGSSGAVRHLFEQRGVIEISVPAEKIDELQLVAIDAGAIDILANGKWQKENGRSRLMIQTTPGKTFAIKGVLEGAGAVVNSASLSYEPLTTVVVGESSEQVQKLLSALDDCDDVTEVYTNAEL